MRRLSLRTEVFLNLLLVVAVAMLLVAVVIVKLGQRDLVAERVRSGKAILYAASQLLREKSPDEASGVISRLAPALKDAGFSEMVLLDLTGGFTAGYREGARPTKRTLDAARAAISRDDLYTRTAAKPFTLSGRRLLTLAYPARARGSGKLAFVMFSDLSTPLLETLASLKIVWIYLFLVGAVVVAFGTHLLTRLVVRPVKRLIGLAGEYREEEFLAFDPEGPENELAALLKSVKSMVARLKEQREELADTCGSLEGALTELKSAQMEVVRSEKLASLGGLAAGLAHELGNPLGIVMGYVELLAGDSLEPETRKDIVARMRKEVERMDHTVRALLSYARPMSERPEDVELAPLLESTLDAAGLHREMKGIKTRISVEEGLTAHIAPDGLRQAVMNLVINSAQAMDGRGELSIDAAATRDGSAVTVRVKDTGPGVMEEDATRVFDPFFTNKGPGKGTGLGLSVAMRLMEAAGGSLVLENPGEPGASFLITLPKNIS